jgi:hypothetical protein
VNYAEAFVAEGGVVEGTTDPALDRLRVVARA